MQFTLEEEITAQGSQLTISGSGIADVSRFDMWGSWRWKFHFHDMHQLLWAPDGVVTLQTEDRDWLVPPSVGLWIPAGVVHGVAGSRAGRVHCLYFDCERYPQPWTAVTPLAVSPLAREILLYLDDTEVTPDQRRPAEVVLLDALSPVSLAALYIPIPVDTRARAVAEAIIADPSDGRDLASWAWRVHTSERTLRRLFVEETCMSFTIWRLHVRMRAALKLLAEGQSVQEASRKVGYTNTASFIVAFSRVVGVSPSGLGSHPLLL